MQPSDQMGLTMIRVQANRDGWPLVLDCLHEHCSWEQEWENKEYEWPTLAQLIEQAQQHVRQAHDHSPVSPEQIERGGFNPYLMQQDDVATYGAALVYAMGEGDQRDEEDRTARAYGWEIGRGAPLGVQVDVTEGNPFMESNWRSAIEQCVDPNPMAHHICGSCLGRFTTQAEMRSHECRPAR